MGGIEWRRYSTPSGRTPFANTFLRFSDAEQRAVMASMRSLREDPNRASTLVNHLGRGIYKLEAGLACLLFTMHDPVYLAHEVLPADADPGLIERAVERTVRGKLEWFHRGGYGKADRPIEFSAQLSPVILSSAIPEMHTLVAISTQAGGNVEIEPVTPL